MVSNTKIIFDKIIIDTDAFSHLFKRTEEAYRFRPYVERVKTFLSFATIGELYFGAFNAGWGDNRKAALAKEISDYIIIPSNYKISILYGKVRSQCESEGHPFDNPDYWIAASALHHDCPLLTNNWKHFRYVKGLKLISPGRNVN
jgi:predicted nucleic acid-binding protein